jgi:predicted small lipoprotein YifL
MRRSAALVIAVVVLLAGCGGDGPLPRYGDQLDRARDVAEQLDERLSDLEDTVGGG